MKSSSLFVHVPAMMLWVLLGCSEPAFTGNTVKSLPPAELDRILNAETFSGVVVAMTSWCPPCKEEMPVLAKLYPRYRSRGIQIIAISLDADGPSAVQPLIDRLKLPFPVYWVGLEAGTHYKIVGVPTTMVFQRGRMIAKIPGPMQHDDFEARLQSLAEG